MSFREKSAWISLVSGLAVWGWYFFQVWQAVQAGETGGLMGLFIKVVVISIGVQIALMILAQLTSSAAERSLSDEREIRIESRGVLIGYAVLSLAVLLVALFSPAIMDGSVVVAGADAGVALPNLIFLALIGAEAIKSLATVAMHRLGL